MCMSSYEVVGRAIEFSGPDRLPMGSRFDDRIKGGFVEGDVHRVRMGQLLGNPGSSYNPYGGADQREGYDEWGCRWVCSEISNVGLVRGHPLDNWNALNTYIKWPDPNDAALYEDMESQFEGCNGKYVLVEFFMLLFERMQTLRGMENVLMDLYLEQERIEMLADRIVEYDLAVIRNISERFAGRIHGFLFTDDWGTEKATFISPELWQEFFKPRYRHIFEAVHEADWHVWMHTCGKVNKIIDDLIDINLDVIEPLQPQVLGIEEIGRRFRGRICFESICDIQRTLPFGKQKKFVKKLNFY